MSLEGILIVLFSGIVGGTIGRFLALKYFYKKKD